MLGRPGDGRRPGLITGRRAARVLSPDARLMGAAPGAVDLGRSTPSCSCSSGCSCRRSSSGLSDVHAADLCGSALAVSLTVIVARIVWVFPATYLPRFLSAKLRERDPYPPPRAVVHRLVGGHARRRLARRRARPAAGLPAARPHPVPDVLRHRRHARRAGADPAVAHPPARACRRPTASRHEEAHARLAAVEAALQRLEDLARDYPDHLAAHRPAAGRARPRGGPRLAARGGDARRGRAGAARPSGHPRRPSSSPSARRSSGCATTGVINDETLRRIERDLDLEALRAGA